MSSALARVGVLQARGVGGAEGGQVHGRVALPVAHAEQPAAHQANRQLVGRFGGQQGGDHLEGLGAALRAHPRGEAHGDQVAHQTGLGELVVALTHGHLAQDLTHVDDPADALHAAHHLDAVARRPGFHVRAQRGLVGEAQGRDGGPRDGGHPLGVGQDAAERRVVGPEHPRAGEAHALEGHAVESLEQVVHLGLGHEPGAQLEVQELAEAGDAQRERRREGHLGPRVEALRVVHGHVQAAEHARKEAHQVEVALEREAPRLLEREAQAHALALVLARVRHVHVRRLRVARGGVVRGVALGVTGGFGCFGSVLGCLRLGEGVQRLLRRAQLVVVRLRLAGVDGDLGQRVARLLGAEHAQAHQALLAHLGDVARDAAVVADQACACRRWRLHVGVVDELPATLPHGGLSLFLRALRYSRARKPSSSPTSRWSQGSRAVTGGCPAGRGVDLVRGDGVAPHAELQPVFPRVEAAPRAVRVARSRSRGVGRRARDALQPRSRGESCTLSFTLLRRAASSRSMRCLRRRSRRVVHGAPLEGRVRLGHVRRHAHRDRGPRPGCRGGHSAPVSTGGARSPRCPPRPRLLRWAGRS
jgi:hypothetical protein